MNNKKNISSSGRRQFIGKAGAGLAAMLVAPNIISAGSLSGAAIQESTKKWMPVSDRKIKVGLVGYGFCKFSAAFGFQDHPNVEVVAVSDIIPERCAELSKRVKCKKTYPSLEELVKDKDIEAVMISTDPPQHAKHCIDALRHGKHVAVNVPAVWGSLEDAEKLITEVKRSGLKYMMFETSCFYEDLYAMRQLYKAGAFGKIIYTEGEYWHYGEKPLPSYKGWRDGGPPQWYCTHSDAYHIGVTDGHFTEVSALGMQSLREINQPGKNKYNNTYATEISLYRTENGGMARMARSGDTPGHEAVVGRVRGQKGSYYEKYQGLVKELPDLERPALPSGVEAGGHNGSQGRLTDEFISAILQDRKPLVDIATALNMTVGGICAHESAMKGGEWIKIPNYKL